MAAEDLAEAHGRAVRVVRARMALRARVPLAEAPALEEVERVLVGARPAAAEARPAAVELRPGEVSATAAVVAPTRGAPLAAVVALAQKTEASFEIRAAAPRWLAALIPARVILAPR